MQGIHCSSCKILVESILCLTIPVHIPYNFCLFLGQSADTSINKKNCHRKVHVHIYRAYIYITFIPVLVHVYQCVDVVHFYILPVISSIDNISSVDVRAFSQTSQTTTNDYATGISNRLVALERRLKALEHVRTTSVVKSILILIHSLSLSLPLPYSSKFS